MSDLPPRTPPPGIPAIFLNPPPPIAPGLTKYTKRKGTQGRRGVIQMLDDLLASDANLGQIRAAFQQKLSEDPAAFFTDIVRNLIPTTMLEDEKGGADDKAEELRAALREMEEATAKQAAAAAKIASLTPQSEPSSTPEESPQPPAVQ